MKKIIYTLIAAFVACTAVAQTPSAYFMEGSTFRSQLNPAFAPLRGYVNIPVLGGVQVNVSGNLSVSDIFYPVNGSLVTLFDKNVSAAEALGNLRSKNMLGTDARINIVGFGAFRKDHKTFWSFDLNMRVEAEANMPYSLFDFLKNGRNEAVINDIKASTQAYLEAAFSYSFPLTDQIYLGARGKFLVGAGRARTSIDRLDIKLQENSWNIDADGSFEMSCLEMSSMQRPDGSEYYSFNDFDVSSYKGPAGYGFAVDLGVTYDVIPDLQLSFAVNDLGFISWGKKYLERGQMTKSQSFTGVEIIDGEVHDPEFDFGELEFDRVQASKGKTEMLRTSINLGAEYEVWRHKIGLGLLYNVRVWDVKTFHNLTASVNFHPIPWFTLTTSYSFLNGQGHALGVAINACPSWINFFQWLRGRGLDGVKLIVGDKCLGMLEAVGEVFPEAKYQRCIVHFYRNVFTVTPRGKMKDVTRMLKAIHAQETREAAREKAQAVVQKLREMRLKEAAKKVEDGIEETLTYYAFPSEHWLKIRTNNMLERLNREIRRRTRVVGTFPDGESALMLVCARLRHVAGTQWGVKRYMSMKSLEQMDREKTRSRLL